MQNPSASIRIFPQNRYSPRTLAIIAAVGVIHIAALWALMNGLAPVIVRLVAPDFQTEIIPTVTHVDPAPPPLDPTMTRPDQPTAVQPVITVQQQDDSDHTVALVPGGGNAIIDMRAAPILGTHTIPPYPALARRLGQEGIVQLRITIGPDGSVADVAIVKSSGAPLLDQTAADWVKAHWRYSPAIKGGAAVASTVLAAVNFNLEAAR